MIAIATLARLTPHPWNITPVGAFGLFAGANMPLRTAWMVPIIPLIITDFIFDFYHYAAMAGVYAGMMASIFIGRGMLKGREKPAPIACAVALNVMVFFVLSNLGMWATGYYGYTIEGLLSCFVAALPFLGASMIGDSFYALVLFGGKALLKNHINIGARLAH